MSVLTPPTTARRNDPAQRGVAARVGAWSVRHRMLAIGSWLLLVVLAVAVGSTVGTVGLTAAQDTHGGSAKAERLLERAGFTPPATESVLVQVSSGDVRQGPGRAAVQDALTAVAATDLTTGMRSPLTAGGAGQVSADGRSALIELTLVGDPETAADRVGPVLDAVAGVAARHPAVLVEQFGSASAERALSAALDTDLRRAERLSVPITFAILLVTFGAVAAALLPLLLALTAYVAALGLLAVTSHLLGVGDATTSVMLLMGLAVGVDYSLFFLKREREERANGADARTAVLTAAATSGRAVLVSGVTVMVALAGLLFTGLATFTSVGIGTIIVVGLAVAGSLTVLPAGIATLGSGLNRLRVPVLGRRQAAARRSRGWAAAVRVVQRFPGVALVLSAGLLLALSLPVAGMRTVLPGVADLPADLPIVATAARVQAAFPGGPSPAQVVVAGPTDQARAPIAALRSTARATGQLHEPILVTELPQSSLTLVSVPLAGNGTDAATRAAVRTLRSLVATNLDAVPGLHAQVTGDAATSADFSDQLSKRTPLILALVLVLAFVLLLVVFRSLAVAAVTVVLNLLSVGAGYGLLVLVFQHGVGADLIGVSRVGPIVAWLPLVMFVILFGLSMDYHVFLLSRIREAHRSGLSTRAAVAEGVASTSGVITSAAAIMVAVFATFATLSQVSLQQLGFGLAAAVLLDATVVRGVLLPATLTMLGERTWYLPRSLQRLPSISM